MKFILTPKITFGKITINCFTLSHSKSKNKLNRSINKPWKSSHYKYPPNRISTPLRRYQ